MKKALLVGLAVLISVAFMTTAFTQTTEKKETTTTTTTPPEKKETVTTTTTTPEKKETVTKTTRTKDMMFTGKVTNMDMAEKMMAVKGRKGEMTFDVSSAKMKGEAKAGDMVTVNYREKDGKMMASSVTRGKARKMKTTTTETETTTTKTTTETKK
jgi:hypothetical protein